MLYTASLLLFATMPNTTLSMRLEHLTVEADSLQSATTMLERLVQMQYPLYSVLDQKVEPSALLPRLTAASFAPIV